MAGKKNSMDKRELGREIRARRIERNLTQAQLGAAAGVSGAMISKIERGRHNGNDVLFRVAAALHCSVSVLPQSDQEIADALEFYRLYQTLPQRVQEWILGAMRLNSAPRQRRRRGGGNGTGGNGTGRR